MDALGVEGTAVRKARRIALIGLRGAGKSSLGAALAERLDVPFIEMSEEIERACGGEGGIRTHGTRKGTPHFECGAFDHSATSPQKVRNAPLAALRSRSSGGH